MRLPRDTRPKAIAALSLLIMLTASFHFEPSQIGWTEASYTGQERVTAGFATDVMPVLDASCTAVGGQPTVLEWSTAPDPLVEGFRVTLTESSGTAVFQTGTVNGTEVMTPGTLDVPASQTTAAWGIGQNHNVSYHGTVSVTAVARGGNWTSNTVTYNWGIGYDWLALPWADCTLAS